ncbi:unnamed protein product (macronuclear) [Paramecium tetraurelia]|uniref:Isovaleryl-CoA dehydrogenase n=1 Tax=Paramecium tetraurelia TaxID=5888 RepID=A0EBS4_PARTE|nr:uncharacterized protein GSPATT00025475001 [Paramecium tetraurelia]CAK92741.1 unnamed protein product [Paramecium tetraurelia]|eukprot:XP_001460138.1 hypothetical protein (macronuclear) [Paramecium tetraurelia strain d4-2]
MLQKLGKLRASFSLLNFNFIANLPPEVEELRSHVAKFANEEVAPLADKADEEGKFPPHLWRKMGDLGLLGATVNPAYGGSGLSYSAHCMILEEISRASGGIGLSYSAHSALIVAQLERHGNEFQKKKYLPKLCSGEWVGSLAMSEPNAGSDVVSMKSTAKKVGDKYILNGSKMWITNGPISDILIVYAKTEPEKKQHGITAFIVEANMKGFSKGKKLDKIGMKCSDTGPIYFDNVEIPAENVLGEVNQGVYVLMSGLDYERLVLAAGPVGLMQAAFDISRDYCNTREQFGKKIGQFQMMQQKLAEMYTTLQASRAMLYSVARAVDQGNITNTDCAALIYYTSANATQVGLEAIQCLGGNGYTKEYPVGRIMLDSKLYEIAAGTNEIRKWLIGRQLTQ